MENTAKINNKKGFSILEIPIAMIILTVGLLFLFGIFPTSFSGVSQGKNILGGTQIAEQLFEQAQNSSFDTSQGTGLVTVSMSSTLNGVTSATSYVYQVTVSPYLADCSGPTYTAGSTPCPPDTGATGTTKLQAAQKKDIEVLVYEQNNPWRLYSYITRIAR